MQYIQKDKKLKNAATFRAPGETDTSVAEEHADSDNLNSENKKVVEPSTTLLPNYFWAIPKNTWQQLSRLLDKASTIT